MTETEKYLYRYYQLERLKALAKNELISAVAEYDEKAEALLKPLNLSNTKVDKTNRVSDPVQDAVIEMLDIYVMGIEKAKASLKQLTDEQDAIKGVCDKAGLNAVEKSYIIWRYFKGKRSWQTAQRLQYSDRQANRYRGSALQKIKAALNDGR